MRMETKIHTMRRDLRFPTSMNGEIVFTTAGRPRARPIPVLTYLSTQALSESCEVEVFCAFRARVIDTELASGVNR
jgi:hypothetical protein